MRFGAIIAWSMAVSAPAHGAETTLIFDGEAPSDGPAHFSVPFTVPPGVVEIEVRHDDLSEVNILDWGLEDPAGFRGWGGGNVEPAIVGINAASRSYVPGPIAAGEWRVVVGKAKLEQKPGLYHIEVTLRDLPTLAPQPERTPYSPLALLHSGARWYAGDFHVHSRESGDARPSIDEIATFARARALDFVMLSDHNTLTQLDFLVDAQRRHPDLLLIPGMEFTTYSGHANAIGATHWVDARIGLPGVSISDAVRQFHAQSALFSVNHPVLDLGTLCIGCAWKHELDPAHIDAVEVATGGWDKAGQFFSEAAMAFWDGLCAGGHHIAPIGGSDDHRAGVDLGAFDSPIGDPTTLVHATELSVDAIIEGVRRGRTVVKLQGPGDPMIELSSSVPPAGDSITAPAATLRARVTGGRGRAVRFVHDGAALDPIVIDADPFEHELLANAVQGRETRWRAEVLVDGKPRTVTSNLWLRAPPPQSVGDSAGRVSAQGGGCGCRFRRTDGLYDVSLIALGLSMLLARLGQRRRSPFATRAQ